MWELLRSQVDPYGATGWYLVVLLPLIVTFKDVSALLAPGPPGPRLFFVVFGLVPGWESWIRRETFRPGLVLPWLRHTVAALVGCWVSYAVFEALGDEVGVVARGYLSLVPLWALTSALGGLTQLLSVPFGVVPFIHDQPWKSRSLGEFWARRWNVWFSDLFRQLVFRPLRRRPKLGLVLGFLGSGLMHEALVVVPYYLATGKSVAGLMTLYFLLQAALVLFERRYLRGRPGLTRVFCWVALVLPGPLVMNAGSLAVFRFG